MLEWLQNAKEQAHCASEWAYDALDESAVASDQVDSARISRSRLADGVYLQARKHHYEVQERLP